MQGRCSARAVQYSVGAMKCRCSTGEVQYRGGAVQGR